jgi:hypothetical protein
MRENNRTRGVVIVYNYHFQLDGSIDPRQTVRRAEILPMASEHGEFENFVLANLTPIKVCSGESVPK